MKLTTSIACALLIALTPLLVACGSGGQDNFIRPGEETSALNLWIWLAADQDTTVRCQGPFCSDGDVNFGFDPILEAGSAPGDIARGYMQFTMPILPDGAQVETAFLELYSQDPYAPGVNLVDVVPVEEPWRPDTMTYDNQPQSFPGVNEFTLTPSNNGSGWWTSPNLKRYADWKFGNPHLNFGFVTTTARDTGEPSPSNYSGYYVFTSNNDPLRTPDTIGRGPRFVLNVLLPPGTTAADIRMPGLPAGHDLLTNGQGEAARALIAEGDRPPSGWLVGGGQ